MCFGNVALKASLLKKDPVLMHVLCIYYNFSRTKMGYGGNGPREKIVDKEPKQRDFYKGKGVPRAVGADTCTRKGVGRVPEAM